MSNISNNPGQKPAAPKKPSIPDVRQTVASKDGHMEVFAVAPAKLEALKGTSAHVDRLVLKGSKETYVVGACDLKDVKPGDRFNVAGDEATVDQVLPKKKKLLSSCDFGDVTVWGNVAMDPGGNFGKKSMAKYEVEQSGYAVKNNVAMNIINMQSGAPLAVAWDVLKEYEAKHPMGENTTMSTEYVAGLTDFARNHAVFNTGMEPPKEFLGDAILSMKHRGYSYEDMATGFKAANITNGLGENFTAQDLQQIHDRRVAERGGDASKAEVEAIVAVGEYFPGKPLPQFDIHPLPERPKANGGSIAGAVVAGAIAGSLSSGHGNIFR